MSRHPLRVIVIITIIVVILIWRVFLGPPLTSGMGSSLLEHLLLDVLLFLFLLLRV